MEKSVAIEVQWSRQTLEEIESRQARYKTSGVRALWLLRQHDIPVSRDTPAFRLSIDSLHSVPAVSLPSGNYFGPQITRAEAKPDCQWGQTILLDEFVRGALGGRLKFAPVVNACMPIRVFAAGTSCWRCHRQTNIVIAIEFCSNDRFPGFGNESLDLGAIEDGGEPALAWLERYLPNNLLATVNIGPIKHRHSRTVDDRYLSNGCIHCDALQGRFFEHEVGFEAEPVLTAEAVFEPWTASATQRNVNRWWLQPA